MTRGCGCEDWKAFMPRLDGIVSLMVARNPQQGQPLGDDWKVFNLCPWCGEELREVDDKADTGDAAAVEESEPVQDS